MKAFAAEVEIIIAVKTVIGKPKAQVAVIFRGADLVLGAETAIGQCVKCHGIGDEIRQFEFFSGCFFDIDMVVIRVAVRPARIQVHTAAEGGEFLVVVGERGAAVVGPHNVVFTVFVVLYRAGIQAVEAGNEKAVACFVFQRIRCFKMGGAVNKFASQPVELIFRRIFGFCVVLVTKLENRGIYFIVGNQVAVNGRVLQLFLNGLLCGRNFGRFGLPLEAGSKQKEKDNAG